MDAAQQFVTILIPLVIIMDPFGNLPFFVLFTKDNTIRERGVVAVTAAASACVILIIFGITGDFILRLFNISLHAFQLAGGFIFFIYSLQMLSLIPGGLKTSSEEKQEGIEKENAALVPLATPMLAGPGAITAVLVWQQDGDRGILDFPLFAAIITACLIVCVVFYSGERISRFIGIGGIRVVTRLMGLLLAVIAVQFMVNGLQQIR
jgi:multiple antibiotic resistance protein